MATRDVMNGSVMNLASLANIIAAVNVTTDTEP